jgi:hypothetical protein
MVEAVVAAYEAPLPNRGVQRMSLRSAADAVSFGPELSDLSRQMMRWAFAFCTSLLMAARVFAAASNQHILLGEVNRITIDASNPWNETIAAVPSDSLNRFLSDPKSPHVTLTTTDARQIAAIVKALGSTTFDATEEGDGSVDLCYRLTFAGPAGIVVFYADAVGNVFRDGRVLRVRKKARWLSGAWNTIVKRSAGSYAPTR